MSPLIARAPRRGEKNTYGLPQGEAIRKVLRAFFVEQRNAILGYIKTGVVRKKGVDDSAGKGFRGDGFRQLGDLPRLFPGHFMADVPRSDAAAVVAAGQQKALGDPDSIPAMFPPWEDFGLGSIELSRRIVPIISAIWEDSGKAFAPRVGLDPDSFYVRSPEIHDAVENAALALSESTNATTTMDLASALAEVRAAVLEKTTGHDVSISDLTARINEVFSLATRSRARMIGITEASRAVHAAQEMAAEKSGTVTGWRWLASEDACPICQTIARRAEYVQFGQPFAVIGEHASYAEIRHPPAHPLCQCSMVEVLIIDRQPEFSPTLIQPVPEAEDYPPDEVPDKVAAGPKPAKLPPQVAMPKVKPKPPAPPDIKQRLDAWKGGDEKIAAIQALSAHLDDDARAKRWIDATAAREEYLASLKPGDKRKKAVREKLKQLNAEYDDAHSWEFDRENRTRAEVAKILKAEKPLDFAVTSKIPTNATRLKKEIGKAEEWLFPLVESGSSWGSAIDYDSPPGLTRANAGGFGVHLSLLNQARTVVHEIGHILEDQLKGVIQAEKDFLAYRIKGQPNTKFDTLFPKHAYEPHEQGADDEFGKFFSGKGSRGLFGETSSWYVGKHYEGRSELLSMGLEALYVDGVRFAQKDPEYAKFIIGILSGDIR